MKVTNISKGPRGLNSKSGPVLLEPGQMIEIDMDETEAKISKASGWFDMTGEASKEPEPAVGYAVTEKGKGWFVVTKDGAAVTKSLRKEDVEGFDAMSDEDKAAFVDLHKAD